MLHHHAKNVHNHDHNADDHRLHTHGTIDPILASTERGIWAIKWSFVGLLATALLQSVVVFFSGSVALLTDTIHNFADATTAVPLGIAFFLARRKPSNRFTFGYGRVEDLAGVFIVLIILISAIVAGYEAIDRFLHPQTVSHLWIVALASLIGFAGNELVALFRIRVGKEINSAALIADGYHARIDGFSSLGVLASVIGVALGFPLADPVAALALTILILRIVWQSGHAVFTRLLDGIDPALIQQVKHIVAHIKGVHKVSDVRMRWIGHWLHAEINLAVNSDMSVTEAHTIAVEARHQLLDQLPHLANVIVHVDPDHLSGEKYHHLPEHILCTN